MPAAVGTGKIDRVLTSGITSVGDVFIISPKQVQKTAFGSGALVTGDFGRMTNITSKTHYQSSSASSQSISFNA
ncbi:hypothetical protein GJU40_15545 [Bacillus lacus]|uniref:Spore germination protein n=1 Tax=Metabacillus lacus TaxID=1983721 RepID=A0A7X2J2V1_9BACI|nr:spore germination protein [Metabacillus lacus]MRX73558.1 hypothetical protein [Metabacillus lacus]